MAHFDHDLLDWEEKCPDCDFEAEEAPWKASQDAWLEDRRIDLERLSGNIMDSELHS